MAARLWFELIEIPRTLAATRFEIGGLTHRWLWRPGSWRFLGDFLVYWMFLDLIGRRSQLLASFLQLFSFQPKLGVLMTVYIGSSIMRI